jgi:putative SOS response-associated peptidase YedK
VCNTYVIRPRRGAQGLAQRVSEATTKVASALVRKSDSGVVVRADGRVELMRWGFHREFNPSINNARSDKLEGGMWKEAFHERRCLIPMSEFYEWEPGIGGCPQRAIRAITSIEETIRNCIMPTLARELPMP